MPSNILESQASKLYKILYADWSSFEVQWQEQAKTHYADTLAPSAAGKKKGFGSSPQLPPPNSKLPPDEFLMLAVAFGKAFDSINKGLTTQTQDYSAMELLNESESQAVLATAQNAIDKQKIAFADAQIITDYNNREASVEKYFSTPMFWIGVVVTIITLGSAIASAGSSLAALPEEAAALSEVAAETAANAGDDAAESTELSEVGGASESGEASAAGEVDGYNADTEESLGEEEETEQSQKSTNSEIDDANAEAKSDSGSWKKTLKDWTERGLKFSVSVIFGLPQLIQGIYQELLTGKMNDLVTAQKDVGVALGLQQQNNMFFRFVQQLLQREGGVLVEETKGAGEIIETFGAIANAYRAIPQGLANAV